MLEIGLIRILGEREIQFIDKAWESTSNARDLIFDLVKGKNSELLQDLKIIQQDYLAYKAKGTLKDRLKVPTFTFRPSISLRSSEIGKRFIKSEDHMLALYSSKRHSDERLHKLRIQTQREYLSKCSFALNIRPYKGPKVNRTVKEIRSTEEKELDLCTFKPTLHENACFSPVPSPRDFDKAVNRVREATKAKEEKKRILEEIPRGENYERNKNMKFREFSFMKREKKEEKNLIMFVDVVVAPGKSGRIAVMEGDQPRELAKSFCKTFQLATDAQEVLEKMLVGQIQNIKP